MFVYQKVFINIFRAVKQYIGFNCLYVRFLIFKFYNYQIAKYQRVIQFFFC